MKLILDKPDTFGALASSLCIIHCLVTPFIFIAHTCSISGCSTTPIWWQSLDYLFLTISFFAVFNASRTTSKKVMKPLLWSSWFLLLLLIVNQKTQLFVVSETITHIVAFGLAGLHLYNLKYCQCKTHKCCTQNG